MLTLEEEAMIVALRQYTLLMAHRTGNPQIIAAVARIVAGLGNREVVRDVVPPADARRRI